MIKDGCGCKHHVVVKILVISAWLFALGFAYTGFTNGNLFNTSSDGYFKALVVAGILVLTTGACNCCCGGSCRIEDKRDKN